MERYGIVDDSFYGYKNSKSVRHDELGAYEELKQNIKA